MAIATIGATSQLHPRVGKLSPSRAGAVRVTATAARLSSSRPRAAGPWSRCRPLGRRGAGQDPGADEAGAARCLALHGAFVVRRGAGQRLAGARGRDAFAGRRGCAGACAPKLRALGRALRAVTPPRSPGARTMERTLALAKRFAP